MCGKRDMICTHRSLFFTPHAVFRSLRGRVCFLGRYGNHFSAGGIRFGDRWRRMAACSGSYGVPEYIYSLFLNRAILLRFKNQTFMTKPIMEYGRARTQVAGSVQESVGPSIHLQNRVYGIR